MNGTREVFSLALAAFHAPPCKWGETAMLLQSMPGTVRDRLDSFTIEDRVNRLANDELDRSQSARKGLLHPVVAYVLISLLAVTGALFLDHLGVSPTPQCAESAGACAAG
jgi:hypothetical protein